MSQIYEIPLNPTIPQRLQVRLGALNYSLFVRWCAAFSAWILDISDSAGNQLIAGIPLITGADLLEQYGYLGIAGSLVCQTDNNPDAPPTVANLGSLGHLYFVAA